MRAVIYLRVSTDKQASKGLSIPAQKERCLQYAKDNGYEVDEKTDIYADEGESARTSNRPQFQILWERCRNDKTIRAVIFYDVSRLARNRIDFALVKQDLTKRGIKIRSATEGIDSSPSGQMLEGVLSTVAEFFSLQSGEKIKLGMLQKVRNGGWPTIAPFGYKNCRSGSGNDKDDRWIAPNDDEAIWVKKTFQMYATSKYSLFELTRIFAKEGFPMRTSKKLHQGFLHRILNNPAYIGKIPFQGGIYEGKHEPLVEQSLSQRVRDVLFEHSKGADRSQKYRFPLKGILYCDVCGSKYTGEQHIIKNGDTVRYLRCMKRISSERVICSEKYFQEEHISNQFEGLFKTIQLPNSITRRLRERIKAIFGNEQKLYEKSRESILIQLDTIKRRKKELVLSFIDKAKSEQDEELFGSIKTDLENKEILLNQQLGQVEGDMERAIKVIEIALTLANNCFRAYKKATPELRGLLAKAFFEKVAISNGQITSVKLNVPIDFLVKNRVKNNPLFKLNDVCGSVGSRTPVWKMI